MPPLSKARAVIVAFNWRLNVFGVMPGNRGPPAFTRSAMRGQTIWTGHRSLAVREAVPQRHALIRMHPFLMFLRNGNFITSTVVSLYFLVAISALSV